MASSPILGRVRSPSMSRAPSMASIAETGSQDDGRRRSSAASGMGRASSRESVTSSDSDAKLLAEIAARSSFKKSGRDSRGRSSPGSTRTSISLDMFPEDVVDLQPGGTLHPRRQSLKTMRCSVKSCSHCCDCVLRYGGVPMQPPYVPDGYIWSPFDLRWVRASPSQQITLPKALNPNPHPSLTHHPATQSCIASAGAGKAARQ